jgi:hypothetical protein
MKKIFYKNLIDSKTKQRLKTERELVNSSNFLPLNYCIKFNARKLATQQITSDWYFLNTYELPS